MGWISSSHCVVASHNDDSVTFLTICFFLYLLTVSLWKILVHIKYKSTSKLYMQKIQSVLPHHKNEIMLIWQQSSVTATNTYKVYTKWRVLWSVGPHWFISNWLALTDFSSMITEFLGILRINWIFYYSNNNICLLHYIVI